MPDNLYFDTLFAENGDKTAVPDALQPDGSVSYDQGFTVDYTLPIGNLDRKTVPRNQTNQIYYDLSAAIQQLQQVSAPPFITTSMNGGSPFSYSKNVRVTSGGVIYQSLTNSNTTTPPGASWTSLLPVVTSGTSILKGDGSGGVSNASAGTDYLTPTGNGSGLTGITAGQVSGLTSFVSSQQTITSGGTLTIAHGLGSQPSTVSIRLVCQNTSGAYSPGDVVYVGNYFVDGSSNASGASLVADTSNLIIRYANGFGGGTAFTILNKTTAAVIQVANADWRAVFVATKY